MYKLTHQPWGEGGRGTCLWWASPLPCTAPDPRGSLTPCPHPTGGSLAIPSFLADHVDWRRWTVGVNLLGMSFAAKLLSVFNTLVLSCDLAWLPHTPVTPDWSQKWFCWWMFLLLLQLLFLRIQWFWFLLQNSRWLTLSCPALPDL